MKSNAKLRSAMRLLTGQTLLFLFLSFQVFAQQKELPRSTPEAEGVSSQAISDFLDAFTQSSHELHSFMILRHGKVIAEGWNKPYAADLKHTLYSVSKSFTATAIGFAVAEGKLKVTDQVITFFPEDLPAAVSENLAKLQIKDLLTMSVGHAQDPTFEQTKTDNWVKAFLEVPVVHEPGSKFLYNSLATYMLGAIIHKVTGENLVDYLQPRFFKPLGIQGADWESDSRGINTGGWGLRVKTEDMAKLGQLFLQEGKWGGSQLLPASWIAEASTLKIEQDPDATAEMKANNDWLQGYCYQMWRSRHNSFRADGAYGQFILVLPDQDAVIAITAETPDMQSELNLVWQHLLPAFNQNKLPANASALKLLKEKQKNLMLPPGKNKRSSMEAQVSGKTLELENNDYGITQLGITFKKDICQLTLKTEAGSYKIDFGNGSWLNGLTDRKGPYLLSLAKGNQEGLAPFKISGSYQWKDDKTLELTLRYIESPHSEIIRIAFDRNTATFDLETIFNRSNKRTWVNGSFTD